MKISSFPIVFVITFLLCISIKAQDADPAKAHIELNFQEFLTAVLANNLDLAIERFDISAAEAAIIAARVFEDPELEVILPAFQRDDFGGMPRNIAFELEIPIETFGKRRYRIEGAKKEKEMAESVVEDFLRYLRTEAALLFSELLVNQLVRAQMNETLEQLEQLIEINQARIEVGEIGEIDLLQTRLEANKFQTEVFDLRTDFSRLNAELNLMMGAWQSDSLVFTGNLEVDGPVESLQALLEQTMANRPDIHFAQRQLEFSEIDVNLARAERLPDFSLIAGYHNEEAIKPSPRFGYMFAGFRIPLQFSGFNSGALQVSKVNREQARTILGAITLEAEIELREAYSRYQLLMAKRQVFTGEILSNAERVRDAALFSYQRGEISLLEVLEAQRTLNEIYLNYYETLGQYAETLVELSRASGVWLVEF